MDGQQEAMEWTAEMSGGHFSRFLETASDLYDQVIFNTDSVFNEPAPEYWVSFVIGGVFSFFGVAIWIRRVWQCKKEVEALGVPFQGITVVRAMISRAIDNDDPAYTVASFAAFSFLFLGGLQLSYQTTFISMIIVYAVMSLGDSLRIVLAMMSANSLADVVQTSHIVHSNLRTVKASLNPSNVYEDLGRGITIVSMVFITQILLIAFVCVDVYDSQTTSCRDGSSDCPVVGTFGSYGFYVLGIFMACVYLLGPKTAFGQSEQNPAYWIQLLIAAKKTGAKISWYDPVDNETKTRALFPNDWRVWARFFMSYLINGVGFHILVHALPIQVATQSSLTGVVFRAVGMMYLVDLDDSSGYTLTIVEEPLEAETKDDGQKEEEAPEDKKPSDDKPVQSEAELAAMSEEAHRIIGEAQEKLNALARGDYTQPNKGNNAKLLAGGTLAAGAILTAGELANANTNGKGNTQDEGDIAETGIDAGAEPVDSA